MVNFLRSRTHERYEEYVTIHIDPTIGHQYLIKATAQHAGLKKQVSAQLLRDTCAVGLLKHGEPIETVLLKLGLSEATWEDAKEKYVRLSS